MASWVHSDDPTQPDTYFNIVTISRVTIGERFDDLGTSLLWWIYAEIGARPPIPVKGPYPTEAAARNALAAGVNGLGGFI